MLGTEQHSFTFTFTYLFVSEAKINDNSLGRRQSRSVTKKSNKNADEREGNHFKSSKDNLQCEKPKNAEMIRSYSQNVSHAIPKDATQDLLHFNSNFKMEKNEVEKENGPNLSHQKLAKISSEENDRDKSHKQQSLVLERGEENGSRLRRPIVPKTKEVECDSSVISKSKVNQRYLSNNHSYEEDEAEKENKLLETMDPRILSIFSPEDDDLSRQDIEDLTFKIEDIYLEDCPPEPAEIDNHKPDNHETKSKTMNTDYKPYKTLSIKKKAKYRRFGSQQEQMLILDILQEKELVIRRKFEQCCDYERKRVYKRLLEVCQIFLFVCCLHMPILFVVSFCSAVMKEKWDF